MKFASTLISTCQFHAPAHLKISFSKVYITENAYRSHIISKKHKESELKAATRTKLPVTPEPSSADAGATPEPSTSTSEPVPSSKPKASQSNLVELDENATEEEITSTLEERIAAARSGIGLTKCLFCSTASPTLEANLTHMSHSHGFFVPEAEFLVDLPGLITYLAEKIGLSNICLYCNGRGREFHSLEAVQKHMVDKSHCKLAYDTERDRLDISDFYDFSSSYPDAPRRKKKSKGKKIEVVEEEGEEWEEIDDDGEEADEVIDEEVDEDESEDESEEDLPETGLTYGDSNFELVLPSGARIGHRSMRRYYAQSFHPIATRTEDPNSGAALVRRLISDRNSALVPRRGGFGAFGSGTDVVKARNAGEAKEAGRHVREFRDQNRREQFKTKVAFKANFQKHFRDPLLQVRHLSDPIILRTARSLSFHSSDNSNIYRLPHIVID